MTDLPIVDAHHHLWQLSGGPLYYPWLQDAKPHDFFLGPYESLKRDYLPPDYRREQQVAETRWLTDLNHRYGMPNAIVAHAWFHLPNSEEILAKQKAFPLARGIRSKPVTRRSARESVAGAPGTMQDPAEVTRAHPDVPGAQPQRLSVGPERSGLAMWRRGMKALAACEHVHCKLSCLWRRSSSSASSAACSPPICPVDELRVSSAFMMPGRGAQFRIRERQGRTFAPPRGDCCGAAL